MEQEAPKTEHGTHEIEGVPGMESSSFDAAKKAFETALDALRREYEERLKSAETEFQAQKSELEKAVSEAEKSAQIKLDEALAAQKAEFEKELLRIKLEELFSKAGFGSRLAQEAAVARFIAEGGTSDTAGEWLTKLRQFDPSAFAPAFPPDNLPHFTVESPPSDDGSAAGGGLLSSMLKKLR